MLKLVIPAIEGFNETTCEFVPIAKECVLHLEHSLVSISKWETKWCKPFLSKTPKTREESVDYIRCMTLTQNVDPEVYSRITDEHIRQVNAYMDTPMTATTFSKDNRPPSRDIITSEVIYYWMIASGIPPEYQKWPLARLLTLINVCAIKGAPPRK